MKLNYLILITFITLFVSCNKEQKRIIEPSLTLKEQITCLVPSNEDTHKYYIGTGNGSIFIKDFNSDEQTLLINIPNKRIYDIAQEKDTLWVGIRNNGLLKIVNGKVDKIYSILDPVTGIELITSYAPYSIVLDNGTLFLGTSSGVYRLNPNERINDSLTCIHRLSRNYHEKYYPINQIKIIKDSIYCAADTGLIVLNKYEEFQEKDPRKPYKLSSLYLSKDSTSLYAFTDSLLYKIDIEKDSIYPILKGDYFAYIKDIYGGIWTLTSNQMKYESVESNKSILYEFKYSFTHRYKNYIFQSTDFILLANDKSLYTFNLHQNIEGELKNIIAAHTINDSICYFITQDNHLHSYSCKDTINKKSSFLGKITNLNLESNIIQVIHKKDSLLLLTEKSLYSIDLTKHTLDLTFPFYKSKYIASKKDVPDKDFNCIYYDETDDILYIGSRHYLQIQTSSADTYIPVSTSKKNKDLYVTDIRKVNNSIHISTLNDGICKVNKINHETFELIPINNTEDINQLINTPEFLLLFTSKGISDLNNKYTPLVSNKKIRSIASLYNKGNNNQDSTILVIGQYGIAQVTKNNGNLDISDYTNIDIPFKKAAVTNGLGNTFLLGSDFGLYEYNPSLKQIESITISPPSPNLSIWFIIILLVIILFVVFIFYLRRKLIINRILKHPKEQIKKMEHYYTNILQEYGYDKNELDLLNKTLREYENPYSFKIAKNSDLDKFKFNVSELWTSTAFHLKTVLSEHNKKTDIIFSLENKKVDDMVVHIEQNKDIFNKVEFWQKNLLKYEERLNQIKEIEKINGVDIKLLITEIQEIKNKIPTSGKIKLSGTKEDFNKITQKIQSIESENTRQVIKKEIEKEIPELSNSDEIILKRNLEIIRDNVEKVDNYILLKEWKDLKRQIFFNIILKDLKKNIHDFIEEAQKLINENRQKDQEKRMNTAALKEKIHDINNEKIKQIEKNIQLLFNNLIESEKQALRENLGINRTDTIQARILGIFLANNNLKTMLVNTIISPKTDIRSDISKLNEKLNKKKEAFQSFSEKSIFCNILYNLTK
ncbi:hypothetical protein LJB92_00290 [Bacteroidales bacterium OttesenSCG-928-M06]|nr:hypothetical protein [Bacteroidales bacterium OttesenSCG-928-M06]